MNYKDFTLGDWIGHISGVIEDETTLDGNEMRDLVEFLTTLEQEPTTKNVLAIDCIVDVLGSYTDLDIPYKREIAENILTKLPSITPQKPQTFRWCTNCREYDQEKHCCHRWSKVIRDTVEEMKEEQEPKTGHCKDCKWWKDSDGEYRRGVRAESQCPINRREVFEGNGYCYIYEPQERSAKE